MYLRIKYLYPANDVAKAARPSISSETHDMTVL